MSVKDNILDDLELEETPNPLNGTNQQLFRGLALGLIVQTVLWALTDQVGNSGYSDFSILEIKFLGIEISIIICMISVSLILGGASFCFFSNASKQSYLKLLGFGSLFSVLSIASLLVYMHLKDGLDFSIEDFFQFILFVFLGLSFITMIGNVVIFRKRYWYLGVILLLVPFICLPFSG